MNKNKFYCRINGKIENLEDIQKLIDKNNVNEITLTMHENHSMTALDALLFEDVIKFNNNEIPSDYNECLERMRECNSRRVNANVPKCPTCGSTNIQKIGTGERITSIIGLGLLSKKINKTYKCNKCKYTW